MPYVLSDRNAERLLSESNRIEGITDFPLPEECHRLTFFVALERIELDELERYVGFIQPGARIRTEPRDLVTVGKHVPPAGGMNVEYALRELLERLNDPFSIKPYEFYCEYQTLHPFTDGNGRSGRALFFWHCVQRAELDAIGRGFLQTFHYRALEHYKGDKTCS